MPAERIIQNRIRALGQSQQGRHPEALDPASARVDDRSLADHLIFLRKLSASVKFHKAGLAPGAELDWTAFFAYPESAEAIERWLSSLRQDTPAHLALLLSFLDAYREAQDAINELTGRHLDFYYRKVLQLEPRAALADRAHLVLELKKNAPVFEANEELRFSAGKDKSGVERLYQPVGITRINNARVAQLRSAMIDAERDKVRFAAIADSADGLGGELPRSEPKWHAFGHPGLPVAETGFALSSPVLRMQEGMRKVTATLALRGVAGSGLANTRLDQAFNVYLSGEDAWLGPYPVTPTLHNGLMRLDFELNGNDGPVVDYDRDLHGYRFDTRWPVLQVQLNPDSRASVGYSEFDGVKVAGARIEVGVEGVETLILENDAGSLNPKKPFQPFGSQPVIGARLRVGCKEALGKKLSGLSLKLRWKAAPASLAGHYSNYSVPVPDNDYFTCKVSFDDAGGWSVLNVQKNLFDASNATDDHTMEFSTRALRSKPARLSGKSLLAHSLRGNSSSWASKRLQRMVRARPIHLPAAKSSAEPREGFITLALEKNFLHEQYRTDHVRNLMEFAKKRGASGSPVMIREPYTPELDSLMLSYTAVTSEVSIGSVAEDEFSSPEIAFFHLCHSGQMREHAYQREQFDFLADKSVSLLPEYRSAGEFLIGLESLQSGDGVSLLCQVAEGSADPQQPTVGLEWSVLCDNYWKQLGAGELVQDTTNNLRTSGLIQIAVPRQATTSNTVLPPGLLWLKAAVPQGGSVLAPCQLLSVHANAIEVRQAGNSSGADPLEAQLPAGAIKRLKTARPSIGKVSQPYASFGARPSERNKAFRTRVSERLRHKGRALTAWDIERIVLQAFPAVHKVKCIPHASPVSWWAPGQVMVVLVPDLANRNAVDPLAPRVDTDTLSKVRAVLQDCGGMQVRYHVKNPSYEQIRLGFKVSFKPGCEFNYHAARLSELIDRFLSPWAWGGSSDISFGGRIYKSVILDFVEEVDFVEFVTDFRMYRVVADSRSSVDVNEASPTTPDAILVSAADHAISEFTGEDENAH